MADAELDSIVNEIKARIQTELHNIAPFFQEQMAKGADEAVKTYKSSAKVKYQRRGSSGGMSDPKNYEIQEGDLSLTVFNNTLGNSAYENSDGWDSGYINDIIETGEGYHWRKSEIYENQPWPRPFMEETGDRVVDQIIIPTVDAVVKQILGG